MAPVRSCVSVNPGASPVKYRAARVGWAGLGAPGRLTIQSLASSSSALGGDGRTDAGCASGGVGFLGNRGRIRRGGREVVAMCSASMDAARPAPVAAVASAVPATSLFPERAKVVALVAAVMLLCNAHRVVMSVAVVPLAAQYGWSSGFLGIVQVSTVESFVSMFFSRHTRIIGTKLKQRKASSAQKLSKN
jgi:MFS transporter, ACS family, solute carrier family 17 (sodium-dependent inorganic phosphate cotransporter), other